MDETHSRPSSVRTEEELDVVDDLEVENEPSIFPLFGAICFCASILTGIACILVATLLHEKTNLSNRTIGIAFSLLLGFFLLFLFSCLCCTYYLGASKESWKIPSFSVIRFNFSNVVVVIGLLIEFVQICSFSFNRTRKFSDVDLSYANYIAVPPRDNSTSFETVYWTMFAIAFTPYIFIVVVRLFIFAYTSWSVNDKSAEFVENFQKRVHIVLWFLVNALYFPVIGTMVAGTDCTYRKDSITLDSNNHIHCLEGRHIAILCCSLLALVVYYPAASFAQAQSQNISDIKFKPRVVFIMLQGKFLLSLVSIFFTSSYYVYYCGLLIFNLGFLILNIAGKPCVFPVWVNRMRTILFALCLWATICSGVIGTWIMNDDYHILPAILLIIGWIVLLIAIPLCFFYNQFLMGKIKQCFK